MEGMTEERFIAKRVMKLIYLSCITPVFGLLFGMVHQMSIDDVLSLIFIDILFAIVFVFQAVALFTIASREGYKNKWMAFVPFLNTYYIGVCAQKNKFYNVNTKTIGLIAAITEAVLVFLYIFALISGSLVDKYLEKVTETHWLFGEYETYTLNIGAVPDNLQWAAWVYRYMSTYILSILDLVFNIMQIIFFSFFKLTLKDCVFVCDTCMQV